MNCGFIIRGEDHVHEDHGEQEGPDEFVEGAFELAAAAGDFGGVSGREIHFIHGVAQGLEAVDAGGTGGLFYFRKIGELYEAAAATGEIEVVDGVGVGAAGFGEAELDV